MSSTPTEAEQIGRNRCERNVYNCILKNPAVKLMMAAMNKSGCPFDVRRHIACEVCHSSVHGGFDSEMNQIVICQNNTDASRVPSILTHEMIHMYDFCKHNIDFKDIDHLACTEIRAANLAHCTFLSAIMNGESSVLRIRKGQQECVKTKAMQSVVAVKNVSKAQAMAAIERVFPRCYADLEPIGRRLKTNPIDAERAYNDSRHIYNFV